MTRRAFFAIAASAGLTGCGGGRRTQVVPSRARSADSWLLPAGTTIPVRSVVRIGGDPVADAQSFGAVIVGDVVDGSGAPVVSSGAPARLVVRPEGLALAAVMIYGTWHPVAPVGGAGTAVGGGALLGTLTRGVIETPVPGSAVTQSMAIRTSGSDVQVPAGSLLIFRLDAPARIGSGTGAPGL